MSTTLTPYERRELHLIPSRTYYTTIYIYTQDGCQHCATLEARLREGLGRKLQIHGFNYYFQSPASAALNKINIFPCIYLNGDVAIKTDIHVGMSDDQILLTLRRIQKLAPFIRQYCNNIDKIEDLMVVALQGSAEYAKLQDTGDYNSAVLVRHQLLDAPVLQLQGGDVVVATYSAVQSTPVFDAFMELLSTTLDACKQANDTRNEVMQMALRRVIDIVPVDWIAGELFFNKLRTTLQSLRREATEQHENWISTARDFVARMRQSRAIQRQILSELIDHAEKIQDAEKEYDDIVLHMINYMIAYAIGLEADIHILSALSQAWDLYKQHTDVICSVCWGSPQTLSEHQGAPGTEDSAIEELKDG